jgi:hypothetical protein
MKANILGFTELKPPIASALKTLFRMPHVGLTGTLSVIFHVSVCRPHRPGVF